MQQDTLFEKIIAKQIPAEIVYQDDFITAFKDIAPQAPVHILIVPNKNIPTINDVQDVDVVVMGKLFLVAKNLAKKFGIADEGYRLIVNCNEAAGQVVFHLHMHLLGGKQLGKMLQT